MYSRAERLFLMPDPDHANPKLGPGSYNPENVGQIWGKNTKKAGYAPFSSLSPRISSFEALIKYTPAPGAYDSLSLPFHRGDRSSFFGRSRATRFDSKIGDTPGPGSYVLPSSLKLRSNSIQAASSKLNNQSNFLTQQPVLIDDDEFQNLNIKDLHNIAQGQNINHKVPIESEATQVNQAIDPKKILLVAKQARQVSSAASSKKNIPKKARITWKRKHVPPSIPIGQSTFGYTEDDQGELVPRKAIAAPEYREPSYLSSFAEESKHSNRGYRFGKGEGRLTFKPHPGPGPTVYDIESPDQYLKQSTRGPAVMALAPCKRLTDEIVVDAVKKGIPGPGAYEVKNINQKTKTQKNQYGFGGEGHKFTTQLETPGPGSYHPEVLGNSQSLQKTNSFGSRTKRFESNATKSSSVPAPGSYELNEVYSLVKSVQTKSKLGSSNPAIAFGSFTERFKSKLSSNEPGPGQYNPGTDIYYQVNNGQSLINDEQGPNPTKDSRITSLLKKGPVNLKIGNVLLNAAQMHIPIFGSQTERFKESLNPVPPPNAYDSEKAFERLVSKGKIENISIMSSHQKQHDLYTINENIPGPGEYNPSPLQKKSHFKSSFASSIVRFPAAKNKLPGPGAYDVDNDSLIKKTYNITLTDFAP